MPSAGEQMAMIAEAAQIGAEEALKEVMERGVKPIVVVNVAWSYEGRDFAIGTRIPEDHGHELLAASLRQSADEAELSEPPQENTSGGDGG